LSNGPAHGAVFIGRVHERPPGGLSECGWGKRGGSSFSEWDSRLALPSEAWGCPKRRNLYSARPESRSRCAGPGPALSKGGRQTLMLSRFDGAWGCPKSPIVSSRGSEATEAILLIFKGLLRGARNDDFLFRGLVGQPLSANEILLFSMRRLLLPFTKW
jgi:hypothetical protein